MIKVATKYTPMIALTYQTRLIECILVIFQAVGMLLSGLKLRIRENNLMVATGAAMNVIMANHKPNY